VSISWVVHDLMCAADSASYSRPASCDGDADEKRGKVRKDRSTKKYAKSDQALRIVE
jgi:hypothetical protein